MHNSREIHYFRLIAFAMAGLVILLYGIAERTAEASTKTVKLSYLPGENASNRVERGKELTEAQKYLKSSSVEAARSQKDEESAREALQSAEQVLQTAEQKRDAAANVARIADRYAKATAMDAAKAWRAAKSEEHYAETKNSKAASRKIVDGAYAEARQLQTLAQKMDALSDQAGQLSGKQTAEAKHADAVLADARLTVQRAEAALKQATSDAADAKKKAADRRF